LLGRNEYLGEEDKIMYEGPSRRARNSRGIMRQKGGVVFRENGIVEGQSETQ